MQFLRKSAITLRRGSVSCHYRTISSTSALRNESSKGSSDQTTHFGFQTVAEDAKKPMVAQVFHGVADSYDVMNDLMSAGMHRLWKDEFIRMLHPVPHRDGTPLRVLDVAGGTGDIAFRIAEKLKELGIQNCPPQSEADIVVCDINSSMLRVGQDRAVQRGLGQEGGRPTMEWVEGDAEKLQFESNSFDVYTIAFGIRNVTRIDEALSEAHRVLRKGGRFMCLEFSHLENPVLSKLYEMYSFNVIPEIGRVVANDRDSYQYLVESIRQFPTQEDFKAKIQRAGFSNVTYTNMTNGVVAVHSGFKL